VDGDALLLQAVLWLDIDTADIARLRRGPLAATCGTSLPHARAVGLKAALGRSPGVHRIRDNLVEAFENEFGVEFRDGELNLTEQRRYDEALRAIETPQWIDLVKAPASDIPISEAVHAAAGMTLKVAVAYERSTATIRSVWFSGDLEIHPARTLRDLEAALRDVPIDRLGAKIGWFFRSRPADLGSLVPQDFVTAVRLAVGQPLVA
jgi:hypothetical protein